MPSVISPLAIRRRTVSPTILKVASLACVGVVCFCGCADTPRSTPRAFAATPPAAKTLATQRYKDPNGYFTILPPAGWRVETYPGDPRGKVAFHGPDGADLRILVSTVDYNDFESLLAEFREKQRQLRGKVDMDLETVEFQDRKAVKKTFAFRGTRFVAYDFMVENVSHDLQYGAPQGAFHKYLPLVTMSMESYEPTVREQSPEEAKRAAVAKRVRLAQLFSNSGDTKLARQMVREGLELDPENQELLRLREELAAD